MPKIKNLFNSLVVFSLKRTVFEWISQIDFVNRMRRHYRFSDIYYSLRVFSAIIISLGFFFFYSNLLLYAPGIPVMSRSSSIHNFLDRSPGVLPIGFQSRTALNLSRLRMMFLTDVILISNRTNFIPPHYFCANK